MGYEVGFCGTDSNVRGRVSSAIESKGRLPGPPEVFSWGAEGLSDENLFAFGASHNGLLKLAVRRLCRLLAHRMRQKKYTVDERRGLRVNVNEPMNLYRGSPGQWTNAIRVALPSYLWCGVLRVGSVEEVII